MAGELWGFWWDFGPEPCSVSGRAADDHGLSSEGGTHPAAHPTAAARNALRSVRSIGAHAERPVLRALALGGHSDRGRCRYLPVDGARACQSDPVAVAQ